MAEWNPLNVLFDGVEESAALIGKVELIGLTALFVFRILILSLVGDSVWGDEKSDFVCNSRQPGCANVCYDRAFPISHMRYWILQFIFVSTPTSIYLAHVIYFSRREKRLKLRRNETKNVEAAKSEDDGDGQEGSAGEMAEAQARLMYTYLASIVFKSVFEGGFLLGQWFLYGFGMPTVFVCDRKPCPHKVECFVSRPMEKTVFITLMMVMSLISFLLSLLELVRVICQRFRQAGVAAVNAGDPCQANEDDTPPTLPPRAHRSSHHPIGSGQVTELPVCQKRPKSRKRHTGVRINDQPIVLTHPYQSSRPATRREEETKSQVFNKKTESRKRHTRVRIHTPPTVPPRQFDKNAAGRVEEIEMQVFNRKTESGKEPELNAKEQGNLRKAKSNECLSQSGEVTNVPSSKRSLTL